MGTGREPFVRASDADRDRVAAALREHFADGRLTIEEFHQRLDAVYASRTYGELDKALVDLPRPLDLANPMLAPVFMRQSPQRRAERFRRGWARFFAVNGVLWSVWGVDVLGTTNHDPSGFWPLVITVPWALWRISKMRRLNALSAQNRSL